MGYLAALPIHDWVPKFELDTFVETGTWLGSGIAHARCFVGLKEFHSIDINHHFYKDAKKMFAFDPHVHLYLGHSGEVLPQILENLADRRILFWLDAHMPEVYGIEPSSEEIRLPLEHELETILSMRPRNDDLIIIDDLRIYEEGAYEHGNLPKRPTPDASFINEMVGDRYNISKAVWQTGFVILSPKVIDNAL
jgi:hypothetical protein